ncbi:hypothetical protein Aperf_G00000072333 [Anoplocephala perfoliata]
MEFADADVEGQTSDVGLKFKPARWPKMDLQKDIKDDLIRSFNLFDKNGLGMVTLDAVKAVLRALGHEIDAKENEALKFMFPEGTVVFSDYMKLLTQWILSTDEDLDVSKAFSLFDVDGKGFINLEDLRRVRDLLGFSHEIDDAELIDMLSCAQVEDSAQELKELYETRQDKTRLRKGQGYGLASTSAPSRGADGGNGVETGGVVPVGTPRRTSSETSFEPSELSVDLEKFKRVLQLESI